MKNKQIRDHIANLQTQLKTFEADLTHHLRVQNNLVRAPAAFLIKGINIEERKNETQSYIDQLTQIITVIKELINSYTILIKLNFEG